MRKRPLLAIACVFLAGLAFVRYQIWVLAGIPVLLVLQELFIGVRYRFWKNAAVRSVVLLTAFLLGMQHMHQEELFRESYLSNCKEGDIVTIWGEVKSFETAEFGNRCIFTDCFIRIQEEILPCNEVMVYTSSDHYQVGEIHEITGEFQNFSQARNQGNFDAMVFYQSQKIDFIVEETADKQLGFGLEKVEKLLLSLKENLIQVYENGMDKKAAGFYVGMVLGDRSNLEESIKDLFAIGGISHILAISGLHVSLIGKNFYRLLRRRSVGFVTASLVASVVLTAYVYMIGRGMSAVRAAGMLLLFFLAQCMGRSYDMLNALGGMCIWLLWENPFLLEYSGVWFSVLALLGVGVVGKIFSEQVKIGKGFWMSVGITLATLPVVAYSYYEIPLYSPLVNMLVLPILTPVFLLALLGGFVGLWIPALSKIMFLPCGWLLSLYESICAFVKDLPAASVICGQPSVKQLCLYVMLLALGLVWLNWTGKMRKNRLETMSEKAARERVSFLNPMILRMAILCVICFMTLIYPKEHLPEITFLDVGQGDGIYISAGDGSICFIDGGSSSAGEVGKYRILPFLKSKSVREVDYWFVSHADEDHISGLLEVLASGYPVKHIIMAQACPKDENYTALIKAAEGAGTKVISMEAGDQLRLSQMTLTCLYPQKETMTDDRNEASLVLQLETFLGEQGKIFRALFAGDISAETESVLLKEGVLENVDLFKVSHHGSKYSNSGEFLEVIRPEIAVISCAEHNLYGHPHIETLERLQDIGCEIYGTAEKGQFTIKVENSVQIKHWKKKFPQ